MPALASVCAPGNDEWLSINIRLDLAPDSALRRATGTQKFIYLSPMFSGNLQIIVNSERAAFHDCPQDVCPRCRVCQSKEYASGSAAPQRSPFACHVGQEEQAVCAGLGLLHLMAEKLERILTEEIGGAHFRVPKLVPEPTEGTAADSSRLQEILTRNHVV